MKYNPAEKLQDYLVFGEFGEVNPSITDSSTFTFLSFDKMQELFDHEIEGCFLYSRHLNPINDFLARALALLENTEAAQVTASGMAAISCALLQILNSGDEIVSSRTIYGGTYALFKNFFPKIGIETKFVNTCNLDSVEKAITNKTKVLYFESISNPLLEVADIAALRRIADAYNLKIVVDNTFSPMLITPSNYGADVVIHSLTKFINGASDCVAGCICSSKDFINSLRNVNSGAVMLLGPTMDSLRAASVLKNMHTLHIRLKQHSKNALIMATELENLGLKTFYPGLKSHPQHDLMESLLNPGFGFGGMLAFDVKNEEVSHQLLTRMQEELVGYFAVSLGFYKTLFSSPGTSTSSEIPKEEQIAMGMSGSLVRMSVGLDNDIYKSVGRVEKCLREMKVI
ncbi:MAG: aminotransferase class I/II-fold pyridoxal phosphate-dependent enzyme [Candidatus Kapabacteria bacterium]|nr:aminotransferase class I/II-fold pyridoxal phosphate-dependent enzyme [Candidatus Kapabacteria bacterium]